MTAPELEPQAQPAAAPNTHATDLSAAGATAKARSTQDETATETAKEGPTKEGPTKKGTAKKGTAKESPAKESSASEPGFGSLGLIPEVLSAIEREGYEAPTPIQCRTVPALLAGRDVLGQAQTGTGKTGAFAWPILCRLDLAQRKPQALVLTPTRELAIQVAEAFQRYAGRLRGFHVLPIYGGQAYPAQLRPLERGVHVVVGTPGRVMDHLRRGSLKLEDVNQVVLDEADEMLRMGFLEDVEWILSHAKSERQTALFSATMPREVARIAREHLRDPEDVRTASRPTAAASIRQRACMVQRNSKLDALTRILEAETIDAAIIFVRTKNATVEVAERLEARGYAAAPLNGDVPQRTRERTVDQLKRRHIDILVATDVAARGLDVERVSHVINFDAPWDVEAYIHRIGRTGRAGRRGEAILFVTPRERRMLRSIENATKSPIEPMRPPTEAGLRKQRQERFKARIRELLAEDLTPQLELVAELVDDTETDPLLVAAALTKLAQADGGQPKRGPTDGEGERGNDTRERRTFDGGHDRERRERRPFDGGREPRERKPFEGNREGGRDRDRFGGHDDRPARKRAWVVPPPEQGMQRYRIAVGHRHGVRPGHVVAALAKGGPLSGEQIGRIELYEDFSTIDLPADMPAQVAREVSKVRLHSYRMRLTRLDDAEVRQLADKSAFGRGPGSDRD